MLESILPVGTLVLGWFLNSFTSIIDDWRNHRKAVHKAIADLLEIRHDLFAKKLAFALVKSFEGIPPNMLRLMWSNISKVIPQSPDLSGRYNEVVTLLSAADPLLGFQLRSKDIVSKCSGIFNMIEAEGNLTFPAFTEWEDKITNLAIPVLNEVITDLSTHATLPVRRKVRKFLKEEMELPPEATEFVATLRTQVNEIIRQAGQNPPAT